jgi:hypothetical protein
MDGYANIELLRERLGKSSDKTALTHLEVIRMSALEEFRELTKAGKTITVDGMTYDAVKRHSLRVDQRERVVFSLGWECVKEAKPAARDKFLDTDVTLHQLDILPNCAFLRVLAMIENVTDGDGAPQIVPIRYSFKLVDDEKGVFRELIDKIQIFYPKVPIGTVEDIESKAKQDASISVVYQPLSIENLLTSQLLARHHFLADDKSLDEFFKRMEGCSISREKAEAFMNSDIEIIARLDKRFLTEPGFMNSWFVTIDEAKLKNDPKEYLTDREFTISEISKIFDEVNWRCVNNVNSPWETEAWMQICKFCFRGKEPILSVAVTMLTLLGWSMEEAHRYLFNENLLIEKVRWGYKKPQIPFTPGVDNPRSVAFKANKPSKTDPIVVDLYKSEIINKPELRKTNQTKTIKCSHCKSFYDSNRFKTCPYCKPAETQNTLSKWDEGRFLWKLVNNSIWSSSIWAAFVVPLMFILIIPFTLLTNNLIAGFILSLLLTLCSAVIVKKRLESLSLRHFDKIAEEKRKHKLSERDKA